MKKHTFAVVIDGNVKATLTANEGNFKSLLEQVIEEDICADSNKVRINGGCNINNFIGETKTIEFDYEYNGEWYEGEAEIVSTVHYK